MEKHTRNELLAFGLTAAAMVGIGALRYSFQQQPQQKYVETQQAEKPAVDPPIRRQERTISVFTCKETLERKCTIPDDAKPAPTEVNIIEPLIQKWGLMGGIEDPSFLQKRGDTDTGNKIAYLNEDGAEITTFFVAMYDRHLKDTSEEVSRCVLKLEKPLNEICWGYATPVRYGPCWIYGIEQGSKRLIAVEADRLDAGAEELTYRKHVFAEAKDALIEDLAFGNDYNGTLEGRLYFTVRGKDGTSVQTVLWDGTDLRMAQEGEIVEYRARMLPNKPRGNHWSQGDIGQKHNDPDKAQHAYNKVWTQPDGIYIGTGTEDIKHRIDFSMPGDKCPVWYKPRM